MQTSLRGLANNLTGLQNNQKIARMVLNTNVSFKK